MKPDHIQYGRVFILISAKQKQNNKAEIKATAAKHA